MGLYDFSKCDRSNDPNYLQKLCVEIVGDEKRKWTEEETREALRRKGACKLYLDDLTLLLKNRLSTLIDVFRRYDESAEWETYELGYFATMRIRDILATGELEEWDVECVISDVNAERGIKLDVDWLLSFLAKDTFWKRFERQIEADMEADREMNEQQAAEGD